ncbi:MAG: hypothetical protein H7Z72_26680 [Bacteroidetes bacterium]|nr:hypothetical protein [Fibrella sp.]
MKAFPVLLPVFLLAGFVTACQDCGPTDEPNLFLTIQSPTAFRVDTLFGVGATGRLPTTFTALPAQQSATYLLPINLNADSTQYTLRIDGREERIKVYYRRSFYYKSQKCGYVFDLFPPSSNVAQQARTTRGRITSITYRQNLFNGSLMSPASIETGVQLNITL